MNDQLQEFLLLANTRGYGSTESDEDKLQNGESIIRFSNDLFEFKDVYYGGEPYSGQEVIFEHGGRAIWAMQYRGEIFGNTDLAPIYAFLGKVLTNTKLGLPRGVDGFSEGDLLYEFHMDGALDNFTADERILDNGKIVYSARFFGGLVDVRKET